MASLWQDNHYDFDREDPECVFCDSLSRGINLDWKKLECGRWRLWDVDLDEPHACEQYVQYMVDTQNERSQELFNDIEPLEN